MFNQETTRAGIEVGLEIFRRDPSTMISLIRGGKTNAYRKVLSRMLSILSHTREEVIQACFDEMLKTRRILLPDKARFLSSHLWTMPHIPIYYLTRLWKPTTVVETGVWTGKSTWFILQALTDNNRGNLISIDPGNTEISIGSFKEKLPTAQIGGFVPEVLWMRWKLLLGYSRTILPQIINQSQKIDIFFHDSDHSYDNMMFEFQTVWPILRPGGFLCSDDVLANRAWKDFLGQAAHEGSSIDSRVGICQKKSRPIDEASSKTEIRQSPR